MLLFTRPRLDTRFTATGLVHHSDAGSQYTSLAFTEALLQAGITGSIGTVGDALDNARMESTIGLYKTELIATDRNVWTGRAEIERETASLGPLVQHRPAAHLIGLPITPRIRTTLP